MKALLIGMTWMLCLYSSQTLHIKQPQTTTWGELNPKDDTLTYGPQLPEYYNHSISEYVRRVFTDNKGNLWIGTNNDGIAKYDGKNLSYLGSQSGLIGSQVTGIQEDSHGSIWFSTSEGISRYTDEHFTNYTEKEGLPSAATWSIFLDSRGTLWAGTLNGLARFNGTVFESVSIPGAAKDWVRAITEDHKGNLWFATANHGAFRLNGKQFTRLSEADGLCSNNITCIQEDQQGAIWLGSMDGGLSIYDGAHFRNFTAEKEIGSNEVWTIYPDPEGGVWFSSEGFGLYHYTSSGLNHYGTKQGLPIEAVQTIYRDGNKRLWIGGGGGLNLFSGGRFLQVKRTGPWGEGC